MPDDLQVDQPPAPAVGLAAGTIGVGVAPVAGFAVGLGVAWMGVGVVPVVEVGSAVGFVAGTVGVVDEPTVGVVLVADAGLVFWFWVLVFPALKVALTATPLPSVVTAIGSGTFNKSAQFSPSAP